nr:immunoglobulin heavy chain junction region [Macaca mulatta]
CAGSRRGDSVCYANYFDYW